jgi:dipeptide/tripeptide permease
MNGASNVTPSSPEPAVPTTHPTGFFFIFWGEFAERCCYYGMRAILALYLTTVMLYRQDDAIHVYTNFKIACYLLPLLGGFLADRYFGKYGTIVGFSGFYVIGLFILGIPSHAALMLALILMACGSGVIKPNISTLMGLTYDQQRPGQVQLRSAAFQWFYFSVNIGALVSTMTLPWVREYLANSHSKNYDIIAAAEMPMTFSGVIAQQALFKVHQFETYSYAYPITFQIPAWLMVGALLVFAFGKRFYAKEVIAKVEESTPEERAQRWKVLSTLFGIFALMVFFWMVYEQNDNLWVYFIEKYVSPSLSLGFKTIEKVPADGYQFINSLCVLIFIPIFNFSFRVIDPNGTRIRPMHKMFAGFLVTACAWAAMAGAAAQASGGGKASGWWIVLAYVVLTIGEVLVYGTGLELSFAAAPANMKSFITACFLLTNAGGNLLYLQFSQLYNKSTAGDGEDSAFLRLAKPILRSFKIENVTPFGFFIASMVIMLTATFAFYFVGKRFNRAPQPQAA